MLNVKIPDGASNVSASKDTTVTVSTVKLTITLHQLQSIHVSQQTVPHTPHVSLDHMVVPLVNVSQVTLDLVVVTMVVMMPMSATTVLMVAQVMQNA